MGPCVSEMPTIGGVFEWEDAQADTKLAPEILNASKKSQPQERSSTSRVRWNASAGYHSVSDSLQTTPVDPNRVPAIELKVSGYTQKEN